MIVYGVNPVWRIDSPYLEKYLQFNRVSITAADVNLTMGRTSEAIQMYSYIVENSPFFEFFPVQLIRRHSTLKMNNHKSRAPYMQGLANATILNMNEGIKSLEQLINSDNITGSESKMKKVMGKEALKILRW